MSSKEICIISANQLEVEDPARNRVLSIVEAFLEKNYIVHLISMDREDYCLNLGENFKHYKTPVIHTKISSFFKRAFLELRIARNALIMANSIDVPIKLITIPSMFLLHLASMLKITGLAVLDIRDLSWEYLSEKKFVYKVAKNIFRLIAKNNFGRFGITSITNDKEYEYLLRANYSGHILKVPNGISYDKYLKIKNSIDIKNEGPISITYIGNIGIAQDLSNLIQVSKKYPKIKFNIVGMGTDFERVSQLLGKDQKNLHFYGRLDFPEILNVYKQTDILYAQLTENFSTAMPSKLYEYLSTGKYIIYAGLGVAKDVLEKFERVEVIPPSDNIALNQAIDHAINQTDLREFSTINRNIIKENFIRDFTVNRIVDEVEKYV
ncbi:glycosyltransferase [Acinetobacter pittii]|uniref:glycosyltransferase n=2 Tax=Acinetobacter pittii TaxID=48296 RepID=UPI0021CDD916|nr:glycosyltransferase [Acinetobacter pittii]MCU4401286.1 glycosyltransferase [Acinetobacter pittii]MCU4404942.1 glycosyltransferase [Acinetobacter pittii]MCU4464770.1 glycosyltransferase [Acinetobacter pittii]